MTKISFDVDFSQDPEKILQEIQKRAEAEVAKREAKDKEANFLSKLHELVNKEIGSDFKNINALIRHSQNTHLLPSGIKLSAHPLQAAVKRYQWIRIFMTRLNHLFQLLTQTKQPLHAKLVSA